VIRCGSKNIHHKDTCLEKIGLHPQILVTILHLTVNMIGGTYVLIQGINTHAIPETITK
jgi:hypothetical protein